MNAYKFSLSRAFLSNINTTFDTLGLKRIISESPHLYRIYDYYMLLLRSKHRNMKCGPMNLVLHALQQTLDPPLH